MNVYNKVQTTGYTQEQEGQIRRCQKMNIKDSALLWTHETKVNLYQSEWWQDKSMEKERNTSWCEAYDIICQKRWRNKTLPYMVPTAFTDDVTGNRSSRVNSEVYRDILSAQFQPYGAKAKAAQKWPDSASNAISTQMNMFFSKCITKGKHPQTETAGGWRKSLAEYKEEPTFTRVRLG